MQTRTVCTVGKNRAIIVSQLSHAPEITHTVRRGAHRHIRRSSVSRVDGSARSSAPTTPTFDRQPLLSNCSVDHPSSPALRYNSCPIGGKKAFSYAVACRCCADRAALTRRCRCGVGGPPWPSQPISPATTPVNISVAAATATATPRDKAPATHNDRIRSSVKRQFGWSIVEDALYRRVSESRHRQRRRARRRGGATERRTLCDDFRPKSRFRIFAAGGRT